MGEETEGMVRKERGEPEGSRVFDFFFFNPCSCTLPHYRPSPSRCPCAKRASSIVCDSHHYTLAVAIGFLGVNLLYLEAGF